MDVGPSRAGSRLRKALSSSGSPFQARVLNSRGKKREKRGKDRAFSLALFSNRKCRAALATALSVYSLHAESGLEKRVLEGYAVGARKEIMWRMSEIMEMAGYEKQKVRQAKG